MDKKVLEIRKRNLIYLRAVISLVIILIAAYNYQKVLSGGYIIFYLATVVATNFVFMYLPDKYYEGVRLQYVVFILDLMIMALGAYFLTDLDFSVFMAMFMTIFVSALSRSLSASIGIAVVMNALYLYIKFNQTETGLDGMIQNMSFLNIPFILLVAVHSSYLAEKADEDTNDKRRLEKANSQLADKAKKTGEEMDGLMNFTARVYDSFREGIVITDTNGVIRAFNRSAEAIFNLRRTKAINMSYKEVPFLKIIEAPIDELKFHKKLSEEAKIRTDDGGTVRIYTVNTSYIKDRTDAVLGMLVTVRVQIEAIGRS